MVLNTTFNNISVISWQLNQIRNVRKVYYLFSMINKKFIKFHDEKYFWTSIFFPHELYMHAFFKYVKSFSYNQ
jgi:hypothetical protein